MTNKEKGEQLLKEALAYHFPTNVGKPNIAKAIELYKQAAELGNADAMANLGAIYQYGSLGNPDIAKAKEWYEKAADLGNAYAMANLGVIYQYGYLDKPDIAKAKDLYERAVDLGNPDAMVYLGVIYQYGYLDKPDIAKAKELYERAADLGNANAMVYLGVIYQYGYLDKPDIAKAKELYERAADLGNADAMVYLGVIYQYGYLDNPDIAKAKEWYEKAADLGNVYAMVNLGAICQYGSLGNQDIAKAKEWYEKAVELGNADAMANLGAIYQYGSLGNPDIAKAKEWYEKAADLGNAYAMANLGFIYQHGYLGNPDIAKAKEWYEKAADLGNAYAMANLGFIYQHGYLGNPDIAKAKEWYEKAADLGNAYAMESLGLIYFYSVSETSTSNIEKAQEYFKKAAEFGLEVSKAFTNIYEFIQTTVNRLCDTNKAKAKYALHNLFKITMEIKEKHKQKESNISLAHFTSWDTIKSILYIENDEKKQKKKRNFLRQYNVVDLNDPKEGWRLLDFHEQDKADEEAKKSSKILQVLFENYYFSSFDESNQSTSELLPSAFVVSMTEQKDRLDLWRAYGRDGNGFALVAKINKQNFNESISSYVKNINPSGGRINSTDNKDSNKNNINIKPPIFHAIKYTDNDVQDTLKELKPYLDAVLNTCEGCDKNSECKEDKEKANEKRIIGECITAILLELLYLYKDEQYSTEREYRAIRILKLDSDEVKMDERELERLYCETAPFLFESKGSEIIIGPKVHLPDISLLNIRYRLTKLGLAKNVVVYKSEVKYR